MRPGLLRGVITAGIFFAIFAGASFLIRALQGLSLDWAKAAGATLMWGGLGSAVGWIIGLGAYSPGSSAHEGPVVTHLMLEATRTEPNFAQRAWKNIVAFTKWALPSVVPNLQTLGIALGAAVAVVGIMALIVLNPIVRPRPTTFQQAADTANVVGENGSKFIVFAIVVLVVLALLIGTAFALSFIIASLSRQVEVAKKTKQSVLPSDSPLLKLGNYLERLLNFVIEWLRDIFSGFGNSITR
jgi:hypothetical protein